MAKRGGLGRGLDALIPDRRSDKVQKTVEESAELKDNDNQEEQNSFSPEVNTGEPNYSDQAAKEDSDMNYNLESENPVSDESFTQDLPTEESDQNFGMVQGSKNDGHEQVINMRISLIEPNRSQPRKYFDDSAISELADSVRQFGIIQPLLVQKKDDYYEIIAGERRWRAANKAGLKEIETILHSSAGLYAGVSCTGEKLEKAQMIYEQLLGAITAKKYFDVKFNIANNKIEEVSSYLIDNKLCADEPTITPGSDFSQINVLIPKAKFPEMVDAIKGFDATSIIRNDLKQLIE